MGSAGSMESSKSLEQEGLLGIGGEMQSLDGLGSLVSAMLDSLSIVAEPSLTILVLKEFAIVMI